MPPQQNSTPPLPAGYTQVPPPQQATPPPGYTAVPAPPPLPAGYKAVPAPSLQPAPSMTAPVKVVDAGGYIGGDSFYDPKTPLPVELRRSDLKPFIANPTLGDFVSEQAVKPLAFANKWLVAPFEKMAQGGEKAGEEVATDVVGSLSTHPIATLGAAARNAIGLPATESEAAALTNAPLEFRFANPVMYGVTKGVGGVVGGAAADPRNWPFLFGGAGRTALRKLISKGFSLQMIGGALASSPLAYDAIKKGDTETASEEITKAGISSTLGVLSGIHGFSKSPASISGPSIPATEALPESRLAPAEPAKAEIHPAEPVAQTIAPTSAPSTKGLPELAPAEHADLESQAGRPLTTDEAHEMRIRQTKAAIMGKMLKGEKPEDIVQQVRQNSAPIGTTAPANARIPAEAPAPSILYRAHKAGETGIGPKDRANLTSSFEQAQSWLGGENGLDRVSAFEVQPGDVQEMRGPGATPGPEGTRWFASKKSLKPAVTFSQDKIGVTWATNKELSPNPVSIPDEIPAEPAPEPKVAQPLEVPRHIEKLRDQLAYRESQAARTDLSSDELATHNAKAASLRKQIGKRFDEYAMTLSAGQRAELADTLETRATRAREQAGAINEAVTRHPIAKNIDESLRARAANPETTYLQRQQIQMARGSKMKLEADERGQIAREKMREAGKNPDVLEPEVAARMEQAKSRLAELRQKYAESLRDAAQLGLTGEEAEAHARMEMGGKDFLQEVAALQADIKRGAFKPVYGGKPAPGEGLGVITSEAAQQLLETQKHIGAEAAIPRLTEKAADLSRDAAQYGAFATRLRKLNNQQGAASPRIVGGVAGAATGAAAGGAIAGPAGAVGGAIVGGTLGALAPDMVARLRDAVDSALEKSDIGPRGAALSNAVQKLSAEAADPKAAKSEIAARVAANTRELKQIVDPSQIKNAADVTNVIRTAADYLYQNTDPRITEALTEPLRKQLAQEMGMTEAELLGKTPGTAFSAEEIEASRKLLDRSRQRLLAANKAALKDPAKRDAFYTALARHNEIHRVVRGIAAREAGRSLQAFVGGEGRSIDDISKGLGELSPEAREAAMQRLATLDLKDPSAIERFVREIKPSSTSDKIYEAWMNSILTSGAAAAKFSGDLAMQAFGMLQKPIAGALDMLRSSFTGSPRERYITDAVPFLYGQFAGTPAAVEAFINTFKNELSPGHNEFEPRQIAIKGTTGRIVRIPSRVLAAITDFYNVTNYSGELHAEAYRTALKEGKSGAALIKRVGDLVKSPTDSMRQNATDFAATQTFQDRFNRPGWYNAAMREAMKAKRNSLTRWLFPFMRTPANIARENMRYSPIGVGGTIKGVMTGAVKGGNLSDLAAKNVIGTAVFMWALNKALAGHLTGGGPSSPQKKAALEATGWQPYSVYNNGKFYSYKRQVPINYTLGMAADIAEAIKQNPNDPSLSTKLAGGVIQTSNKVLSNPFLPSLVNIADAMQSPNKAAAFAADELIPGFVRDTAHIIDPTLRQARTPAQEFEQNIPGMSQSVPARIDITGQPIQRPRNELGGFYPFPTQSESKNPIVQEAGRLGIGTEPIPRKVSSLRYGLPRGASTMSLNVSPLEGYALQKQETDILYSQLQKTMNSPQWSQLSDTQKQFVVRHLKDEIAKGRYSRLIQLRQEHPTANAQ